MSKRSISNIVVTNDDVPYGIQNVGTHGLTEFGWHLGAHANVNLIPRQLRSSSSHPHQHRS